MVKLAHSMIRVTDEARSLAFYEKAFDLKVNDRLDFENFTLLYLISKESDFELELTVNKGRDKAYEMGDGYGHLALIVNDLEAARAQTIAAGANPKDIVDFRPAGERIARFFFVADPDGYQIEVIERGGRFQ